jgi:hypothetical protein
LGRGEVRLPVRVRLSSANMSAEIPKEMSPPWRSYACPECSDTVGLHQLGVVCETVHVDVRSQIPEDVIKDELADQMAWALRKHDLIEFRRTAPVRGQMQWAMIGTLLVAPKKTAANIEDHARDRATDVARQVVDDACAEINNWGSRYGHREILKQDANRLMGHAMQTVLRRLEMVKSV